MFMNTIYKQKSKKAWTTFMIFLMALFIANENYAQTNPGLHNLGASDYTFTSWAAASTAGTYPASMIFWTKTGTADPVLATVTPDGDYDLAYNLTTGSRVNGLDADGFSFINTGTAKQGFAVLGLNTLNRENITVTWTGGTVVVNARIYAIRLQYRIGSGSWTDVPGPIEYVSNSTAGHSETFGPTLLPAACNDQPAVFLRWTYHYLSGTGTRPQMRVDDITVSSTALGGPPPAIITPSTTSITAPSYNFGGSPSSTSFTIDGINLTGNPTITASANFQVSLDNATFSSSVSVPVSSGTFTPNPRTIWVRLANGLSPFIYNGTLQITGGGIASPIDINLNGEVTGSSIIAAWDFEGSTLSNPNSPTPSIGNGSAAFAGATYGAAGGVDPSSNPCVWSNSGSAWAFSNVPPASSEFSFFTSTVNFSNIVLTYDMRFSNASTRSVQVQYTTNGGSTWTNFPLSALNIHRFCDTRAGIDGTKIDVSNPVGDAAGDARVRVSLNFSAIAAVNNIAGFGVRFLPATFQATGAFRQANTPASVATGGTWRFDNINFEGTCSTPAIVNSNNAFNQFTYVEGNGPSTTQTTDISGNCLSGNITITAPANFEVSTNISSGYGPTVVLTPTSGVVASTTIYVRMVAGLVASVTPYTGNLSITSPAATAINTGLSGLVSAPPTVGNIIVARANAVINNTTADLLEFLPNVANQTSPTSIFGIDGVGATAIPTRFSGSATSTMYVANSNDGSQLLLTGHASDNSSGNANTILPRRVLRLNANGDVASATTYTGASGQQTRGASTINNTNYFIGDQNGAYTNGSTTASPGGNFRAMKAFGGTTYVGIANASQAMVNTITAPSGGSINALMGIPNSTNAQDFYLIRSGYNGNTFDVLYTLEASSATAGTIRKFSLVSGTWVANGSFTTDFGGFGLSARKSGIGADLYVTTGTGATSGNAVRRLVDVGAYNQTISITANDILFSTPAGSTLKGVAFSPIAANAPNITTSLTLLDNLNYVAAPGPGGPSASQSFTVSGSNLTGGVTVTAPTNFQVSLDNSTFSNSLNLPNSGTTLTGQPVTVWVRAITGLTANTYLGAISLTTNGGLERFVNVRSIITDPVPTITLTQAIVNFTTYRNLASASQTYTVSGAFLNANISITVPTGYEHRIVGNPTFQTGAISLTQTGGTVAPTNIEIRLASGAIAVRNGNINFSSVGSNNPSIAITGEVMPRIQISEIHYNPNDAGGFPDEDYEFLEFRNFENIAVDISGYSIIGIEYTIPTTPGSLIIPASQRVVLAKNPTTYTAVVPAPRLFGWTGTGALSNSGETIAIRTTQNNTVNSVTYQTGGGWPTGANGGGPSLELVNQAGFDENNNPANWCAIGPANGTPGASNTCGIIYYSTNPGVITDAIWAIDPTTPPLSAFPGFNEFSDIVVRHIVELNPTATQTIRNLTVNAGGRLWRNVSVTADTTEGPSNLMRYIDVFGNLITVNGVLGNPNLGINDLLGINLRGGNYTITGNGTINIGRIRKQFQNNTTTLNINANMRLGFNGTVIYNNLSGNNSRFDIIVNEGRTLNVTHPQGALAIDGTQGTAAGDRSGSYTINGTVNVATFWHRENSGFNTTNLNSTGVQTTVGPNGRLNVKNLFMQTRRGQASTLVQTPLTIQAGGRVTITDDGTLTLFHGPWDAQGGLFVNDGASVLHGVGTPGVDPVIDFPVNTPNITGNATIRRTGSPTINNTKYNYWSSPVENVTLNSVVNAAFNPSNSILNLYIYNPALPSGSTSAALLEGWVNVPPSTVMQATRGYITTGANTVSFSGVMHNGGYNYTLEGGPFIRMNLIGNPYPSGISAVDFLNANGPSGTNRIENNVYFWTDDSSQGADYAADDYVAFNGSVSVNGVASKRNQFDAAGRIINVGQGFVVSANSSAVGQQLNFNNSMRRASSGTPFFSTEEVSRFHFTISNQNNLESEIAVCFREDLTDNFDVQFDTRKMFGNPNIALYTMVNGEAMMIDGYGDYNNARVIDLGVTAKLAGTHTIEINKIENMDPSVLVFIENIATGEFHNLRTGAYSFNSTGNMTGVHFRLHFREPVTVNALAESCEQTGGKIEINIPFNGWSFIVKNAEGHIVAMEQNPMVQNEINHLDAGDYTVILTYADGYSFEKYLTVEATTPVNANVEISASTVSLDAAIVEVLVNADNASYMSINMGDGTIYNAVNYVSHAYNQIGTYQVMITVNNEFCTSTYSSVINVTAPITTGINNLDATQIAIFPNPAKETANVMINVPSNEGNLTLNVVDVNGRLVMSRQISANSGIYNETIDLRNLDSGVYQLNIQGNQFKAVKKLVVQK